MLFRNLNPEDIERLQTRDNIESELLKLQKDTGGKIIDTKIKFETEMGGTYLMDEESKMSLMPVTPSNCALAIGIPLTKKDFFDDLENEKYDYARKIKNSYPGMTNESVWCEFAGIARYIRDVCDEVSEEGVKVVRNAKLSDIASLFQTYAVVTIFTHSSWPPIKESDIIDSKKLIEEIWKKQGTIQEALRKEIRKEVTDHGSIISLSELARVLGKLTKKAHEEFAAKSEEAVAELIESLKSTSNSEKTKDNNSFPAHYLTRPALELIFSKESLVPAKAIELRDGLHSLSEFIEAIPGPKPPKPVSFSGVIDLTICNSSLMAPAIKHARPDCIVAVNKAKAYPEIRFASYRVVIKTLKRRPAPFGEVLAKVHSALLERRLGL